MPKFSFIHTGKVIDDTCMCGLLKCSPYCPAKYADSYDILPASDNLAPYLGSNWDVIDSVFDIAEVNDQVLVDLGAGDGRVLIRAVQRGAKFAVGYELNKSVFELGKNHVESYKNIQLYNDDCRSIQNFNDYNIITMFLLPEGLQMLEPFLSSQLRDTSENEHEKITVVSLGWPVPNWKVSKRIVSRFGTNIYLYYKYSI
jgi:hypothetical protein